MKTLRVMCAISCFFAFGAAAGSASAKSKPNLKVTVFAATTGSHVAGAKLLNTATVANKGKASAAASRTTFHLSLDRKKSKDDIALAGEQKVAKLKKGKSKKAATSVTIPAGAAAGSYYVGACADGKGAVKESNEKDNCSFSRSPIVVTAFPTSVNTSPPPVPPAPDADGDGVPDATDCRPDDAKLPPVGHKTATACESAIRDIAEFGPDGAAVAIEYALVTAKAPGNHIYIQVDDVGAGGDAEYSGVEVEAGSAAADLQVGDHVDVIGIVSTPNSGRLVTADSVTVVGTPSSVVFTTITAAEFEAVPHKYDAVPITIAGSFIAEIAESSWSMITGYLVSSTLIGTLPPNALVGDSADVSGIGDYDGSEGVLLPRESSDVFIPIRMVSFDSFGGCVAVGNTGPVATVTLNHASPIDFMVQVDSDDGASMTITGGGVTVLAGNTSGIVLGDGISPGGITLTAQLGAVQLTTSAAVCPDD